MKGEVSDAIIVIGILGIVFITVSTAYISLDEVSLPQDEDQTVSGGVYEVSADMARLVESCWRQSGKGSQSRQSDCFNVKIYSNDTVSEQNISEMLERMSGENFGFQGTIPEGESTAQVSYRPVDDSVNISTISICRPSQGDTCFSTECSCQTGACGPGFDPDGDGNAETDSKGCITEYSFDPVSNPCDDLSCSDEGIFVSGERNGDYLELDLEDKLGLRDVFIAEYPVSGEGETYTVESENLISPREAIGTGNTSRKLFSDEGRVNISDLEDDKRYGLFIWGCDYGGMAEHCRWLEPYMINGDPEGDEDSQEDNVWIESFQISTGSQLGLEAEIGYDLSESKTFSTELRNSSESIESVERTVSGEGSFTLSETVPIPESQETYTVETDSSDQISEENEADNIDTSTFTPSSTNLEAVSLDLDQGTGTLEIQGQINYDLPEQENIKINLYQDGTVIKSKTVQRQGTGTETVTETKTPPENEKTFKLSADPQDSLEEDVETDNNITKQYSPENEELETFTIDLEAGWNIISSPVQADIQIDSISSCNLKDIQNGREAATLKEEVEYTDQITSNRGYLLNAQSGCTFEKQGLPADKTGIEIYEGWNLVSINGSMSDYTGCTGLGHGGNDIWTYDPTASAFVHSIDQLWQGFYLKSGKDCTLTNTGVN